MDLQSSLKNLNFTEKEAAVYLALLQTGQSTAYQVAKKSGLKKPTTYVILDNLVERGAVRKILHTKNHQYLATDPVELFVEARSRVEQAEAILPQLRAMAQNKAKIVETSYYEGVPGIKEMYKNLLKEMAGKTYVGFFAHQKDTPKELMDYWKELNAEMAKRKIKMRGVTTKDATLKEYFNFSRMPQDLFDMVGLSPKVYSSNISMEIYEDFTQIISHRYVQGILIRNPDIANVMRQIFEIVRKSVEK